MQNDPPGTAKHQQALHIRPVISLQAYSHPLLHVQSVDTNSNLKSPPTCHVECVGTYPNLMDLVQVTWSLWTLHELSLLTCLRSIRAYSVRTDPGAWGTHPY